MAKTPPDDATWKKNSQAKQRRYARGPITRLAVPERLPKAKRTAAVPHGGGRPAAQRAAKTAARLEMQAHVWRLLVSGGGTTSFKQIGREVGCSEVTAWRYALAYANRLDRQILGDAKTWRMVQASQIQAIKEAHWKNKGKKTSADVILRAMEREAKLLGIDREPDAGVYSGTQVKSMLQGLFMLFVQLVEDVELRRQFALGIRRQLPAAVKTTPGGETIVGEVEPTDASDETHEDDDE